MVAGGPLQGLHRLTQPQQKGKTKRCSPAALASGEELNKLVRAHVQELVQVDALQQHKCKEGYAERRQQGGGRCGRPLAATSEWHAVSRAPPLSSAPPTRKVYFRNVLGFFTSPASAILTKFSLWR
jgi:hypothetical protein